MIPPSHVFISGLGYCGIRIANSFREAFPNIIISGSTRSAEKRDAILECNDWLNVFLFNTSTGGLDKDGIANLKKTSHLIETIAPFVNKSRDPLLALHGNVIHETCNNLQWVGYLSSTGVYGDHNGEWVTENSKILCTDEKSLARINAENEWRLIEQKYNITVDVFRCGGIYGPGRGPLFNKEQERIDESDKKYVNRILVNDICGALLSSVSSRRPPNYNGSAGRVYNLVDNEPAPRSKIVMESYRLLNKTYAVLKNQHEKRTSRNTGNKRCSNTRLKQEYGWQLIAPTYREGLAFLHRNEF